MHSFFEYSSSVQIISKAKHSFYFWHRNTFICVAVVRLGAIAGATGKRNSIKAHSSRFIWPQNYPKRDTAVARNSIAISFLHKLCHLDAKKIYPCV